MTYQSRCHAHESHEDVRETHLGLFFGLGGRSWKMQPLAVQKDKNGYIFETSEI